LDEGRGYITANRNKRSIAIDLKHPRARPIVASLVRSCDVVLTNYRDDTLARLGIDYKSLREINQELVYMSIKGVETGKGKSLPGYDLIAQASSGVLAADEKLRPDGVPLPVTSGAIIDYSAGYAAAFAVCAALVQRARTGGGCLVETSLRATALGLMNHTLVDFPDRLDFNDPIGTEVREMCRTKVPFRDIVEHRIRRRISDAPGRGWWLRCYMTADGLLAVACVTAVQRRRLLNLLGMGHLDDDQRDEVTERLEQIFGSRSSRHWIECCEVADVPVAEVSHAEELLDDLDLETVGLIAEFDRPHPVAGRIRMLGPLLSVNGTRRRLQHPSPTLGEHSEAILRDLGLSGTEIDDLRAHGAFV
jgi:formyl-CoA transferase